MWTCGGRTLGRFFEVFVIGAVAFGLLAAFAQFNEMTSVRAPREIVHAPPPATKQVVTTGAITKAAKTAPKPNARPASVIPLPVRKDLTRPEPAVVSASVSSPAQPESTEPAKTPRSIVASSDTRQVPVTTALMAEETVKAPTGSATAKVRTASLEKVDAGEGTVSDARPITTTEDTAKSPVIAVPSRNPQAQERRVAALATERTATVPRVGRASPASKPSANKRKLRRKASQKRLTRAAKRRKARAARRAKRSSRPLVRTQRVCDRYGRCQKIMMVRKPRNAREYRQLQRLRKRMIANARRNRHGY